MIGDDLVLHHREIEYPVAGKNAALCIMTSFEVFFITSLLFSDVFVPERSGQCLVWTKTHNCPRM